MWIISRGWSIRRGDSRRDLADDELHPNAGGYRIMAPIALESIDRRLTVAPADVYRSRSPYTWFQWQRDETLGHASASTGLANLFDHWGSGPICELGFGAGETDRRPASRFHTILD